MFDVRLLSVCGGLAVVFALRRRHIAELGGLRTHPKNTNRVHWSGKTRRPFRLLFVATQSLHILRNMVHRVAKAAENRLRCRVIGTRFYYHRSEAWLRKKGVRYASGGTGAP